MARTDRMRLAVQLRAARKAAGITQQELGDALGLTRRTINRIETGAQGTSSDVLLELERILGVQMVLVGHDQDLTKLMEGQRAVRHHAKVARKALQRAMAAVDTLDPPSNG